MPHPDDTHPQPPRNPPPGGSARAARTADRAGAIDPRLLAELQARLTALEAWRAHQSDLLDDSQPHHRHTEDRRRRSRQTHDPPDARIPQAGPRRPRPAIDAR